MNFEVSRSSSARSSDAHAELAHCLPGRCKHQINFPQGSEKQYVGKAGKPITVVFQIYSVYYVPNIILIGQRL